MIEKRIKELELELRILQELNKLKYNNYQIKKQLIDGIDNLFNDNDNDRDKQILG